MLICIINYRISSNKFFFSVTITRSPRTIFPHPSCRNVCFIIIILFIFWWLNRHEKNKYNFWVRSSIPIVFPIILIRCESGFTLIIPRKYNPSSLFCCDSSLAIRLVILLYFAQFNILSQCINVRTRVDGLWRRTWGEQMVPFFSCSENFQTI